MASDPPLRESRMLRRWAHGFRSSAKGKEDDTRLGPWPPVLRCGEEVRRGGVGRERQSSEILPRVALLFLNVREESNTASLIVLYLSFLCYNFVTFIRSTIPFSIFFLCLAENLPCGGQALFLSNMEIPCISIF